MSVVTFTDAESGRAHKQELFDLQPSGSGRADWQALEKAFRGMVEPIHTGYPSLLREGPYEGFTRRFFEPGTEVLVTVKPGSTSTTVALLKQVLESQQTQAFVSASLLAQHSPYRNDTEPSTAASNVEFKTALIKHYQLPIDRDDQNRLYVTCQATGERLLSGAVVAGHLFPRKASASGADWGVLDPDNDIRNGLVWYDGIEQVWTNHQLCLQEDGLNLVLRVLDKDIMDKSPVDFAAEKNQKHATQHLKDLTFGELDGRAIIIPPGVQGPYQRVIVTKAAHAIIEMWKRGKLREDIQPYRLDVTSTFRQQASCLAWVKTTMVHLQHWPIGPEAEDDVEVSGAAMVTAEDLAAAVEGAYDDE